MTMHPTAEQIQQLVSDEDTDPVVMLNLLRFKDEADGIDAVRPKQSVIGTTSKCTRTGRRRLPTPGWSRALH